MKKEKSRKTGVIIFAIFIALSMVLSIFAIVLDNQGNNGTKYNGYKFSLATDGYKTKINNKVMTFQYFPSELESLNLSQDSKDLLSNSVAIAMLFNPNSSADDLQYIDYARFSFDEKIDKPIYFVITQQSDAYSLPVLSCDNATSEIPFLVFNISSDTSIVREGNCIIMNAKLRETLAVEERIAYQMIGVMK